MSEKLNRLRKENPNINAEIVNYFEKIMPKLLDICLEGYIYDCHIGSKEEAIKAEKYIKNERGETIGFHWGYEELISVVKNFINLNDAEFYPCDIWVWANVKYGDMAHIVSDMPTIIKYAIAELTDSDYPFHPASQRAYFWLKKHIENEEK